MKLAGTQFSLPTKSYEIYLSGCNGNCKGCHNPELKDFSLGEEITIEKIKNLINKIKEFDNLIEKIWILGGEPLDQNIEELGSFLNLLNKINKEIWLFTRYEINEIPVIIKEKCHYIKTGKYIEELKTNNYKVYGIYLATINQKIHKKGVDY